ncbi:ABC-2 family transporter protein [Gynuella sp.]|uniref:ABC-2 family transporter protein n=1 Tax=Gynuella sp. TaxID=2969146 RepID=UPI003D125474
MHSLLYIFLRLKELLTYKVNIIVFMLYGLLPLISAVIVRSESISTYYLLVFFISQVVNGWTANQLAGDVSSGQISHILILPRSFRYTYFLSRIAMLIFVIPTLLVVLAMVIYMGFEYEHLSILPGLASIFLSVLIQFNISIILGLISAWTVQSMGIISFWFALLLPLSGTMFPLDYLPSWILNIILFTPFPYYVYVPAKVFVLSDLPSTLVAAQGGVLIITYMISKYLEIAFQRKYMAYGS